MTTVSVPRRAPVQARSRQTVARILDAAVTIADQEGVDAVTTRTIADRAGVSYPSLYRFFADRDAILDELMERHCAEIDALCVAAEQTWEITSFAELLPSSARWWAAFGPLPIIAAIWGVEAWRHGGLKHMRKFSSDNAV